MQQEEETVFFGFSSTTPGDVEESNKYATKDSGLLKPLYNSISAQQMEWGLPDPISVSWINPSFLLFCP